MKCPMENPESMELLLDYHAQRLNPTMAAALQHHLEECQACREVSAGQREVWAALDDWEPVAISADFDRRLYERLEREERKPWWRRIWNPSSQGFWRPALPLGAAACLLLLATSLLRSPVPLPAHGDSMVQVRDVEQVERTLDDLQMLQELPVLNGAADTDVPGQSI